MPALDQDPRGAPAASVIVLNYNGAGVLPDCLAALAGQELAGGFEVLVVDNGSGDGSAELVRRDFPGVRLVEAGRNLGFAAGNNLGMREARGPYLVLLNNDTRVRPGWLAALVAAADTDPRAGAVTAKILFAASGAIQNAGSLLLSDGSGADRGFEQVDTGQFDTPEEVFAGCGASLLLRRRALEATGGLDEDFFMYYEDTDLCWRLRLRGWRVLYEPRAVVDHLHAVTSGEWSEFFIFHVDRNRLLMILKNAPWGFVLRSFAGFYGRAVGNAWRSARGARGGDRGAGGGRGEAAAGPPGAPSGGFMPRPGRAKVHVKVALSFAAHAPLMVARRLRIRRGRRMSDAELRRWLYPREKWDARSA
ncbi:MAG TPA: glycosyltransferase family 2 protein [Candidatus Dormibacteraeota bacterium]|jgi:hypothetical protein|nr:glycosyltransferase family 2 protein [Candidatus Dormibacteraeota bacterium]